MNEKEFHVEGKRVGVLKDGIFRKEVSKKRHLFRNLNAFGIQASVADVLYQEKCKEIRIKEKDDQVIYSIDFDTFMKNGEVINVGAGLQYCLGLHWFRREPIIK